MIGQLKCGWGCGAAFHGGDERSAHEQTCPRRHERPAKQAAAGATAASGDARDRAA
jgi:hypothetical protein